MERIEELGAQPLRDLIEKVEPLGGLRAGGAGQEENVAPEILGGPCQRFHYVLYLDWWLECYGALGPGQLYGGDEGSSRDLQGHPLLLCLHQC